MTASVAFVTAPAETVGDDDIDRPLHEAACAAIGIELDHPVWSDPLVDWGGYDFMVVRSVWDYPEHLDAFRHWLARMDPLGTLHNPARVIAWNLDKRYLLELGRAGVPVIPTQVCTDLSGLDHAMADLSGEVVVKPVVSAACRSTGRFASGDPSARRLATDILAGGSSVMVQPAVASVATAGEVSTLVFGGRISHSVRKGPLLKLGGGLAGGHYSEWIMPEPVTPSRRKLVDDTMGVIEDLVATRFDVGAPLLYARVDVVMLDDGSEAVLEVELAEPAFFLSTDPTAADRFAEDIARRVSAGRAGDPT